MDEGYDCLRLENHICFPLYVCSKEVVKRYRPMLEELDITYTQYSTMMALWEKGSSTVNALGDMLYLDSGTLSPLLKSLESKGLIRRDRSKDDERAVIVTVTDKGMELRDRALSVPGRMAACISLPPEKGKQLYDLLYEVIGLLDSKNK